ncbi:hypothetical protein XBJ1_1284 [Xenorhabdus bovienii SS-2004]|uniref:Uncharacterized protein n=1 Tax=Xenorhabdus bovienii (strain SS-2004) TaxID=406818 RepID=D3UXP2_XENBS|nr:hypothetical protein XBJ1_1284 [Xenorhabdus bovienii SS-2004]
MTVRYGSLFIALILSLQYRMLVCSENFC